MKLLFRDHNLHECHLFKGLLESEGIPCFIKNEHVCFTFTGITGSAPDFWPELCVLDDQQYERAKEIINSYRQIKKRSLGNEKP